MTDDPVTECVKCGRPVQRVFHPVAVHFKGKGFYNTDYGTKRRARELEKSASERCRQDTTPRWPTRRRTTRRPTPSRPSSSTAKSDKKR